MKDDCGTPFWGKQKPLRHYITNGSLSFSVKEGKLFCKVTRTTKASKQSLYSFEVLNKMQLDSLLKTKSLSEITTNEVFN